jgi:alpha-D-xyloside xylohydrolase
MRRFLPVLALLLACSSDDPAPTAPGPSTPKRPEPTGPCGQGLPTTPDPPAKIHTPRWAFEPWISKDISNREDTYAFVEGFEQRGIPVGVVVLDSPWETSYNSLIPHPVRYRDFPGMVADLRAKNIRTVLWLTAFLNTKSLDLEEGGDKYDGPSPNYEEAATCGFFAEEGRQFSWWKGFGAHLDFSNPKATAWWHWQLDKLLDAGVAGFKLDFGDSYVRVDPVKTAQGTISHQEFSEAYYRDFYDHGVAIKGPEEYVTMVRPYDKSYDFEGRFFARKEHAPVGWVGDNRRDWVGLRDALDHMFRSVAAGYVVVGSDIGGYLDRDDLNLSKLIPADTEVFLRWTALGALTPFMQLHGRANATPWTVPDRQEESVAAWRYWATLHREMIPFFYSLAEEAYAGGKNLMRLEGSEASWEGDYRFHVGDALLVAPILEAGNKRSVLLPAGARYLDWWQPASDYLEGGTTVEVDLPDVSRIPVYIREGAILPLEIANDVTGLGDASFAGALSSLVYPGPQPSRFVVHGEEGGPFAIEASLSGGAATVTFERAPKPLQFRVRGAYGSVALGGQPLAEVASNSELAQKGQGFRRDDASRSVWVRVPAGAGGSVVLSP